MDPIANMFTKIRNAQMVGKTSIADKSSKIKVAVLELLQKEGFIESFKEVEIDNKKQVEIILKYKEGKPAIRKIARISKPGCRLYASSDKIPYVLSGKGRSILSTSKGLMTDKEARKQKIGGELIGEIY